MTLTTQEIPQGLSASLWCPDCQTVRQARRVPNGRYRCRCGLYIGEIRGDQIICYRAGTPNSWGDP